jgi:tetratricopeptide (TPR) repeat protein
MKCAHCQCHGNPVAALKYYEEALQLAEQMAEPQLMFPCLEGMATVYLDQGEDARAEDYFNKADAGAPARGWTATRWWYCRFSARRSELQRASGPTAARICAALGIVPSSFGLSGASICVHRTNPSPSTRK